VVAGPKDVVLQVTGLEDSLSVAVEGKKENDEERKIMAKIGHDQVEEHMERVKSKVDDEKIQGAGMKMQLTYPAPGYVGKQSDLDDAYSLDTERGGGIRATQEKLDGAKNLAVSKAEEILRSQGAYAHVLASKPRKHPSNVPSEHSGKHIMHADGTISLQGEPALQRSKTTAEFLDYFRERQKIAQPQHRSQ
jgi:hypothetical protein